MFSVIRAHQLKALNFQLPTYVSEDQNDAERSMYARLSVCPSVGRKKFFLSVQIRCRYQLCVMCLLIKSQGIRCRGPKLYVH